MPEFHSPIPLRVPIPDDLTIPQFIFNYQHQTRQGHPQNTSPWLIDDASGTKFDGSQVRSRVSALANGLFKRGVGDGDIVLIFSRNHIDYVVAVWAIQTLGAIVSGANPSFTSSELVYQLEATRARAMIADPEAIDTALSAAREVGLADRSIFTFNTKVTTPFTTVEDLIVEGLSTPLQYKELKLSPGEGKRKLALLSFSSGTTGRPKAVAIPHHSVIANVIQMAVHNRFNEDYTALDKRRFRSGDVVIGVLPFYHIYGFVLNIHLMIWAGMSLVVVPKFNFVDMLKSIVRYRITHLFLVPPQAVLLCKHPAAKQFDLSHVRFIMTGAAPLTAEINEQLFSLLPNAHIGQAYGMTETCTATTMFSIDRQRGISGSSGQLLPGVVAKVVKLDGTLADYDEVGELWAKSPSNAIEYRNNPQATSETFVNGWVRTGDEVMIKRNDEVFVVDRIKEIMKVKGHQVAPAELEGCILDHPDVTDVCVVGIPDDYSGEVPLAFVVPNSGLSRNDKLETSIMNHVKKQKVPYKHLTGGVVFVDVIPKNPSGKLLRRVLRDQAKELVKARKLKAKL